MEKVKTMAKTKTAKEIRSKNLNMGKCQLDDLAKEHGWEVRHMTEYQIRINNILDVYPTSKKYCNLRTKIWGQYESYKELVKIVGQHV